MTTNNNNPNPLYPKDTSYTLEEFVPVIRAAEKMGLVDDSGNNWFVDKDSIYDWDTLFLGNEPYTLLCDVQVPYGAPKPLTVEEIKAAGEVWYCDPDDNNLNDESVVGIVTWHLKACAIAYDLPCYATKEDCKRAHGLEVPDEVSYSQTE